MNGTPDDVRVGPILTSHWSQGSIGSAKCYNYHTPLERVCGCTATSLAQIMYYHRYPTERILPGEYLYDTIDDFGKWWVFTDGTGGMTNTTDGVYTEFSPPYGGPYQWDKMVDSPSGYTLMESRSAIGQLTRDAGLAVFSHYFSNGTTSGYTDAVASSIILNLHYADAVRTMGFNSNKLIANLDAGLPVEICLASNTGHHSVIVDGYGYHDGKLYIHLNYGYGGISDGWYDPTTDINGKTILDMVANIFPPTLGERHSSVISGHVLDASGNPVANVTVAAMGTTNVTTTSNANGIYAFILPAGKYTFTAMSGGLIGRSVYTVAASKQKTRAEVTNPYYQSGWKSGVNNSVSGINITLGSPLEERFHNFALGCFAKRAQDFDVGDYAPTGLVGHFDGIRNAGAGQPHDSSATTWVNLGSGGSANNATLTTLGSNIPSGAADGEWTDSGYYFKCKQYFDIGGTINLDKAVTIQLATEWTTTIGDCVKWALMLGGSSANADNLCVWHDKNTLDPVNFKLLATTKKQAHDWDGHYLNAIYDGANSRCSITKDTSYVWQTEFLNGSIKDVNTSYVIGTAGRDDSYKGPRMYKGIIKSVRIYDQILPEDQLVWNRYVDEMRFSGASLESDDIDIVIATSVEGLEGVEPCGDYMVNGNHTFSVPAANKIANGHCWRPVGYTLEKWDGNNWTPFETSYALSFAYTNCLANGKMRLTWNFKQLGQNEPDAFVEYVESDGRQWIDLSNLTQTRDITFDADIDWISGNTFIGQGLYDQNPLTTINGEICCKWYMSDGDNGAHTGVTLPSGRHRFVITGKNNAKLTVSVDGGEPIESNATSSRTDMGSILDHSLYLFAQHEGGGSGSVSNYSSVKLYGLKVWQAASNGVLRIQCYFIPCVKDGRAGLYDAVSGVIFYSHSGTDLTASSTEVPLAVWRNEADDASLDNIENWSGNPLAYVDAVICAPWVPSVSSTNEFIFSNLTVSGGDLEFSNISDITAYMLTSDGSLTFNNLIIRGNANCDVTINNSIRGYGKIQSLTIPENAFCELNNYDTNSDHLYIENIVLNGEIRSAYNALNLTIIGSITGKGHVYTLPLRIVESAVFKPSGTSYLQIDGPLSGILRVDISDPIFEYMTKIKLIKVPSSIKDTVDSLLRIPPGWDLMSSGSTSETIEYWIERPTPQCTISIR